jgi:cell division septal protein FtsQ
MRTREARRARKRLIAAALILATGVAGSLYGLWVAGQWVVDELVFRNPAFAVRQLEIDTGQRLPAEMVLSWSGIRRGDNLIQLDLDRVKHRLELLSVVQSVSLERLPPDTLRIRVIPRLPVAEIRSARKSRQGGLEVTRFYVDGAGVVLQFPPASEHLLRQHLIRAPLPQLLGIHNPVAGRVLAEPNLGPALQLLEAFEGSQMVGLTELESVDLSRRGVLEVRTSHGALVTFGLGRFGQQLARWRRVYDYANGRGQVIATLDLSVTNHVPAVLEDKRVSQSAAGSSADNSTPG